MSISAPWLESETLQRFRFNPALPLSGNMIQYFSPSNLEREVAERTFLDKPERDATQAEQMVDTLARLLNPPPRTLGSLPFPEVMDKAKAAQELAAERIKAKALRNDATTTKPAEISATMPYWRTSELECWKHFCVFFQPKTGGVPRSLKTF